MSTPTSPSTAAFYRREADRLLSLAQSVEFSDVGNELTAIARQYQHLAEQSEALDHYPEVEAALALRKQSSRR